MVETWSTSSCKAEVSANFSFSLLGNVGSSPGSSWVLGARRLRNKCPSATAYCKYHVRARQFSSDSKSQQRLTTSNAALRALCVFLKSPCLPKSIGKAGTQLGKTLCDRASCPALYIVRWVPMAVNQHGVTLPLETLCWSLTEKRKINCIHCRGKHSFQ